MGLFAKLSSRVGGLVSKLAPAASFIPGVGPVASRVMAIGGKALSMAKRTPAGVVTAGKYAGGAVATGAAFEVGGRLARGRGVAIDPRTGMPYRKRRGQGLSARDIRGAQKVARIVQHFGYKPKIKPRKRHR